MNYETPTKLCKDCRKYLPLSEFYDSKRNAGGKHVRCKICYRTKQEQSKVKYIDKYRESAKIYRIEHADKIKKSAKEYRTKHSERLRRDARERKAERIANMTPDELTEFRRKRREDKRIHRAKKYGSGGRHSDAEWAALLDICGGKCLRCGTSENISRDHIIPLTSGGSDDISNIQPLCKSCNSSKNSYDMTNYRTEEVDTALALQLRERNCIQCGKLFPYKHAKKKYCSRGCSIKASNLKASNSRKKP